MEPAYLDPFLVQQTRRLAEVFGCDTILETGTHRGGSAKILGSLFRRVISIEVNSEWHEQARAVCPSNVELYLGSSPEVMRRVLRDEERLVVFLDAHWGPCPLLDELRVLRDKRIRTPIILHDFQVPGTDLGYDSYDHPFNLEYVAPVLAEIFPDGYEHFYNETNFDNRGILFVHPKISGTC